MKTCSRCKLKFTLDNFHRDKKRHDGLRCYCKPCANQKKRESYVNNRDRDLEYNEEYRLKNSDKIKEYSRKYSRDNAEKKRQYSKQWRLDNIEKAREYDKNYIKNNRAKLTAKEARRNANKAKATPKWLTRDHHIEINSFFEDCREVEWLSDCKLEVDHIIPIRGKNVCGLHVPWNLQILNKIDNTRKSNKFDGKYNNTTWKY